MLINTSVRNKDVAARFTVVNRERDAKRLKVKATILDAGRPVMEVGSETMDLGFRREQAKWRSGRRGRTRALGPRLAKALCDGD